MSRITRSQPSMLEGPIRKGLISFAIPILLGNLFQQLYNTADTIIVGNFIGKEALAAVSSSGNLIPDITMVFTAYPVTWSISSVIFIIYYFKADWIHNFDRLDRAQ